MDLRKHVVAGEEWVNIWNNRALGDKFLKFGMVFGMGSDFCFFFLWPQKNIQMTREQICYAVKYRKNGIT